DARSRASAGESRRDDGDIQPLEGTRDVDAFAAGKREALARPVTMAQLEVRHRQRAVDRGVQGHRDDHENQSLTWLSVRPVKKPRQGLDRKSTRLNSSHVATSYAVFCLKKKKASRFSNAEKRLKMLLKSSSMIS